MHDERMQQIEQAIAQAEAQGQAWTNRLIYERVGGSYETLAAYLKARRASAAHEDATTAVAVEEPPEPDPPLARARQVRDRTAQAEHALGLEEQALKQQRRALEEAALTLTIQGGSAQQSDRVDLERRRQAREIQRQLEQGERQRQAVHQQRLAACEGKLAAQDAYAALHGQAARWVRRLRAASRVVHASPSAYQRGEAREELAQAQGALAQLVGEALAQALADDVGLQPDWLGG